MENVNGDVLDVQQVRDKPTGTYPKPVTELVGLKPIE